MVRKTETTVYKYLELTWNITMIRLTIFPRPILSLHDWIGLGVLINLNEWKTFMG